MENLPFTKKFSTPITITGGLEGAILGHPDNQIRTQDISSLGGQLGTISSGTLTFAGQSLRISESDLGSAPVLEPKTAYRPIPCPECKGDGHITLFTSVTVCVVCLGSGRAQEEIPFKQRAVPIKVDKDYEKNHPASSLNGSEWPGY